MYTTARLPLGSVTVACNPSWLPSPTAPSPTQTLRASSQNEARPSRKTLLGREQWHRVLERGQQPFAISLDINAGEAQRQAGVRVGVGYPCVLWCRPRTATLSLRLPITTAASPHIRICTSFWS